MLPPEKVVKGVGVEMLNADPNSKDAEIPRLRAKLAELTGGEDEETEEYDLDQGNRIRQRKKQEDLKK